MTPEEHWVEAECLLQLGRVVVQEIREVPEKLNRNDFLVTGGPTLFEQAVRERRDDLGKQAMGIWAQAQVHATLASNGGAVNPGCRQYARLADAVQR